MTAVVQASERPEEREPIPGALQKKPNFDPTEHLILVEIDGNLVGYARITHIDETEESREYGLLGYLLPAWRRKGIGSAMLGWLEERARELERSHADGKPATLRAGAKGVQEGLRALLERSGYQPIRYFFVMLRPTLDDIPDLPLPPGIEVRAALPEHYPAIWKAIDETARDEWGYRPFSEEDYQSWMKNPSFQPDLWQIAWDTAAEVVAGHVLTYIDHAENEGWGRKRGYTEGIGVVPAWRRRGLAAALIAHSLQAQKSAGMEESGLVVDSENSSGALSLYERCGFHVVERNAVYRKRMT
jgi:mycothiol synthase